MIYIIGFIVVILGVALDQFTKHLAVSHLQDGPIVLIDGVFQLQYLENRGAAFGMLQNQQVFFIIISIITLLVVAFIYIQLPKSKHFLPLRICMMALVAGAIGNMIDRIRLQYVVDFFYFELIDFPIFNVADIFATVATIALIVLFLFYYTEEDLDRVFRIFSFKKKEKKEQG